jgi:hypothetical protein
VRGSVSAVRLKRSMAVAGICAILLFSNGMLAGRSQTGQNQLSSPAADAELIAALKKNGVRLEADRITAWFSPESMPRGDMESLLERLAKGVGSLEAFLRTPRRWQDSRRRGVE